LKRPVTGRKELGGRFRLKKTQPAQETAASSRLALKGRDLLGHHADEKTLGKRK